MLAGKQSRNVRQRAENFIAGVRVALAVGGSHASWLASPLRWGGAVCSRCAGADCMLRFDTCLVHAHICLAVCASPTHRVLAVPQSGAYILHA